MVFGLCQVNPNAGDAQKIGTVTRKNSDTQELVFATNRVSEKSFASSSPSSRSASRRENRLQTQKTKDTRGIASTIEEDEEEEYEKFDVTAVHAAPKDDDNDQTLEEVLIREENRQVFKSNTGKLGWDEKSVASTVDLEGEDEEEFARNLRLGSMQSAPEEEEEAGEGSPRVLATQPRAVEMHGKPHTKTEDLNPFGECPDKKAKRAAMETEMENARKMRDAHAVKNGGIHSDFKHVDHTGFEKEARAVNGPLDDHVFTTIHGNNGNFEPEA